MTNKMLYYTFDLDLRHRHGCIFFTLACHLAHDVLPCFSVHIAILPASVTDLMPPICISCLMQSIHLLAGLPFGLLPSSLASRRSLGYLSCDILLMCPKNRILFWVTLSMTLYLRPSDWRIFVFLILSRRDTPMIFLRHIISKTRSLFSSSFFRVQVSAP